VQQTQPPRPDVKFQRVKVLEHARKDKWKVEFLDDPNPGLVDYVGASGNAACLPGPVLEIPSPRLSICEAVGIHHKRR
jgi:hypothetical protein